MNGYIERWLQYRRLRKLTFLPLLGCVLFVAMLTLAFDERQHPILWNSAGAADLLFFLLFCYYGIQLSRFRCPRCGDYFSRGKAAHRKHSSGSYCRHCGLPLYGEA